MSVYTYLLISRVIGMLAADRYRQVYKEHTRTRCVSTQDRKRATSTIHLAVVAIFLTLFLACQANTNNNKTELETLNSVTQSFEEKKEEKKREKKRGQRWQKPQIIDRQKCIFYDLPQEGCLWPE